MSRAHDAAAEVLKISSFPQAPPNNNSVPPEKGRRNSVATAAGAEYGSQRAESLIRFTSSKYEGKTVTGLVGSSVNFTWSFTGDVRSVSWGLKHPRFPELQNNGALVVLHNVGPVPLTVPSAYNGRVSGRGDVSSGQVTFTLSSIRHSDERFYGCFIRSNDNFESPRCDAVHFVVKELPAFTPSLVNGSYIEGTSVNISCTATGKPDPEVSWMRNGRIKSSGKKITYLNFDRIKRTDDGLYTCRANNSAGTKRHKEFLVVRYPAEILSITSSAASSWIGQTVTLKCVSDGVPTPTLTWYKPDGNELNTVTAKESTMEVTINSKQDFGQYKCVAYNGLDPANHSSVLLEQIKETGSPAIEFPASDIQATSLTVKWTAPADDGGSPITAYRVVILKGGTEIKNENVTDPGTTSLSVGSLERDTEYSVKVFARNAVFEGTAAQKTIRTKIEGIPETPEIIDMPAEVQSDEAALKWTRLVSNGADITQYTVYIRNVSSNGTVGDWRKLEVIHDVSVREYVVTLQMSQRCEFVVTATNKYGESLKEQKNIKRIRVLGGSTGSTANQNQTAVGCYSQMVILHAVYLGVIIFLVVIIVVICILYWRKRRCLATLKRGKSVSKSSSRADCIQMDTIAQQVPVLKSTEVTVASSTTYEISNSSDYMSLHPSTRNWEISREQVNIIKIIGKGAFSQVAKATTKNIFGNQKDVTVAVKMLQENAPDSDRKDLLSELELMKKLTPHPFVIKLMGCVTETEPLLVLIEYVPYGDLLGYLRKSRGLNDTYFNNPDIKPKTNLTSQQLMRFAWQIADGMTYLSTRKIIHRDLAARNVLVGEGEKCKVTDFGMSRNVYQDNVYTKQSRGRLPVKWTAYEALLYGTYTTQSDV
ncbi:muscle, skeletal receptor tyrosine-protein kinase-like [Oculina patagonica]